MHEHGKARCIEKIDLYVVPLGECQGILHRRTARYILFVIGSHCTAVIHSAQPLGHFGGLQQRGNQGGLTAMGMTYQSDISNVLPLIGFQ